MDAQMGLTQRHDAEMDKMAQPGAERPVHPHYQY